jgi:hypothetical protein
MSQTCKIEQTELNPQTEPPLAAHPLPSPDLSLVHPAEPPGVPVSPPASPASPAALASLPLVRPRSVGRNGKIARLPALERDMVNRMLNNNLPHRKIVAALDELGIHVTERNISNWKTRGGYKEWCYAQECALQTRLQQDNLLEFLRKQDASQLPEIGLQIAATEISKLLLQPESRQQLAASPEKYGSLVSSLCRLATQLDTLQKNRDEAARKLAWPKDPKRLQQEDEKAVESVRETFSSKIGASAREPNIPHRNFLPKPE